MPCNVFIVGSGRSGTSLAAGCLSSAGYFMGEQVYQTTRSHNPKGIFEDRTINEVNERIIADALDRRLFRKRLNSPIPARERTRWLSPLPVGANIRPRRSDAKVIQSLCSRNPFCFKDPRLSYTLPAWIDAAKSPRVLCIFRHPAKTILSIEKEVSEAQYLTGLDIKRAGIEEMWKSAYKHILNNHSSIKCPWMFLHYDQLMTPTGLGELENFSKSTINKNFPTRSLRRSEILFEVTNETLEIYKTLCRIANYEYAKTE